MNLLKRLSKLERYEIVLPSIGRLHVYILCTKLDDEAQRALREAENRKNSLVSLVPLFVAEKHSYEEMLTALLEAYTLVYHGQSRARIRGLETLRILCREKDLGKVARQCGARPGEEVVVLIASPHSLDSIVTRLRLRECTIRIGANETSVTKTAVFPIDARLFKIHSDIGARD